MSKSPKLLKALPRQGSLGGDLGPLCPGPALRHIRETFSGSLKGDAYTNMSWSE